MNIENIYWRAQRNKGFYEQYEKKALAYTQLMREDKVPSGQGISDSIKTREGIWRYRERCVYYANLYDEYLNPPAPDFTLMVSIQYNNVGSDTELYYEEIPMRVGDSYTFPDPKTLVSFGEYDDVSGQWQDDMGNYYNIGDSISLENYTLVYFVARKAHTELTFTYNNTNPLYFDTIQVVNGVPDTYILKEPDVVGIVPPTSSVFNRWRYLVSKYFNPGDEFTEFDIYDRSYLVYPEYTTS